MDINRKYLAVVAHWGAQQADDPTYTSPLTDRQDELAEAYTEIVSEYGPFNQGNGPDGCNYHTGPNNPDPISCNQCIFYGDHNCAIVEGTIDPAGLCDHHIIPATPNTAKMWQPKKSKKKKSPYSAY